ncbi:MAG: hypothetical protein MUF64_12145 [Polyangiaceae bacterium]|nr:hypothetical protein [Polyangiaceae bacterium]
MPAKEAKGFFWLPVGSQPGRTAAGAAGAIEERCEEGKEIIGVVPGERGCPFTYGRISLT